MKYYYNLFFLPFILIISISLFAGFSPASEYSVVENLLKERTEILHKVYFQQLSSDKGEKLLYSIETHPLLASDIRDMREYADTDMDMVRKMEVLSLEKVSNLYGMKSYRGDILWHMQGAAGRYVQSIDYSIVIKKGGAGYKLSEFSPIFP